MLEPAPAAAPKRAFLYLFFDKQGIVDDYVPHLLQALRPFGSHILVVSNGALAPEQRAKLDAVADDVLERDNVGFDVWGYKEGLERLGDRVQEFDEIVMLNYTFFGPVRDLAPVFARADASDIDFWGLTSHAPVTPHPYLGSGTMPGHVQSHWIAVRRSLLQSEAWRDYWETMPPIESYFDSITQHESRFTKHFEDLGFRKLVHWPYEDYASLHPIFENAELLLEQGVPILKRRIFFHDPMYLDREAIIGRRIVASAVSEGYPEPLIWQNLARTVPPRTLNTNASMLEILPDVDTGYDPDRPLRTAAIVHVFYDDMIDELLDHLACIPGRFDLFVTTTDDAKRHVIEAAIARRALPGIAQHEVRVLESNRGRDLSGYFVACRDVLTSGAYELVVKIHSKKTVQSAYSVGKFFARQQFENLLPNPGYAANLFALFQREPGLGIVFPPMIHTGYPTAGRAWFVNRERTEKELRGIGIEANLDHASPLAPFGAMWVARPEALLPMTQKAWRYEDYSPPTDHRDGSLAHVQERMPAYVAASQGFHARTVANAEYAAISHTFLEYKLQDLAQHLPGDAYTQSQQLRHLVLGPAASPIAVTRAFLTARSPKAVRVLRPVYGVARGAYRGLRSLRRRLRGGER